MNFHSIFIKENTRLHKIISKKTIMVNSAHHQAVKKPGEGLVINAFSEDG